MEHLEANELENKLRSSFLQGVKAWPRLGSVAGCSLHAGHDPALRLQITSCPTASKEGQSRISNVVDTRVSYKLRQT